MKKTYEGSCHCRAVRFACELDLEAGTTRCNCTFCGKNRFWMAFVPAAEFRLTTGAEILTDYRHTLPGKPEPFLHLTFCSRCGVRPFSHGGPLPQFGGPFYAVNVACLDGVPDAVLAAIPVHYADGKNNDWQRAPAEVRHL
jgi:hypothetical protein